MDDSKIVKRCPITFVGSNLVTNQDDLNNLFIMPYEMNMVSSVNNAISEDKLVRNAMFEDSKKYKEEILNRAYDYESSDVASYYSNTLAYIVMNVRDLVYNCVLKMGKDFIPSFDIQGATNQIVLGVFKEERFNCFNAAALNNNLNKSMDIVYGMLIAMIFDQIIIEYCDKKINNGTFENEFETMFRDCYGDDSFVPELHQKSIDFKYTFVSSCLRETMQPLLTDLRAALCAVAFSATNMINDAPIYRKENYLDQKYNVKNLIESNDDLAILGAVNNLEGVSDGNNE